METTRFATAQVNKLDNFSKEDLVKDYQLARDIIKKQHPNPYKFIDSVSLDRKVDSLMKLVMDEKSPLSGVQFLPIHLLRDVHTNCRFSEGFFQKPIGKYILFFLKWGKKKIRL